VVVSILALDVALVLVVRTRGRSQVALGLTAGELGGASGLVGTRLGTAVVDSILALDMALVLMVMRRRALAVALVLMVMRRRALAVALVLMVMRALGLTAGELGGASGLVGTRLGAAMVESIMALDVALVLMVMRRRALGLAAGVVGRAGGLVGAGGDTALVLLGLALGLAMLMVLGRRLFAHVADGDDLLVNGDGRVGGHRGLGQRGRRGDNALGLASSQVGRAGRLVGVGSCAALVVDGLARLQARGPVGVEGEGGLGQTGQESGDVGVLHLEG
jgi:hypothetical protein